MLGAQARAAELQAAKSAAMRQRAHREVEEHILPPESAPVSLTDFARNSSSNKNKGVKAFRPLIDSDFESTAKQIDSQISASDTSSHENLRSDSAASAPVAPRAMLNHSDLYAAKLTPSRARAPVFTPSLRETILSTKTPETPDYSITTSPRVNPSQYVVGHVFGPEDLSPSKQEMKFTQIRRQCSQHHRDQGQVEHFSTSFMPDARMFTPQHTLQHVTHIRYSEVSPYPTYDPYICYRPAPQHFLSEFGTSATGYSPGSLRADGTQTFADDLMNHQHRLLQQGRAGAFPHTDLAQPYDRNSKMQSFVAAQQAMAKKGKTVLHNPDLYRPSEIKVSMPKSCTPIDESPSAHRSFVRGSSPVPEAESEVSQKKKTTTSEDKEAILQAILKRIETQRDLHQVEHAEADTTIPGVFPDAYRSEDWYTLRSITLKEREQLLNKTRNIRREASPYIDYGLVSAADTQAKPKKWAENDCGQKLALRAALEQTIEEHQNKTAHPSNYGIIGRPISREQSDLGSRGALKAVAWIMTELHDTLRKHDTSGRQNRYTEAPKYAINENYKRSSIETGTRASLFSDIGFKTSKPACSWTSFT